MSFYLNIQLFIIEHYTSKEDLWIDIYIQKQPPKQFSKISVLFFQEQPFYNFPRGSICSSNRHEFSRRFHLFVEQTWIFQEGLYVLWTDTNFPGGLIEKTCFFMKVLGGCFRIYIYIYTKITKCIYVCLYHNSLIHLSKRLAHRILISVRAICESSHRDLLTKNLFERGYLPGKCLFFSRHRGLLENRVCSRTR